jgi:hypothetical protein
MNRSSFTAARSRSSCGPLGLRHPSKQVGTPAALAMSAGRALDLGEAAPAQRARGGRVAFAVNEPSTHQMITIADRL